MALTAKVLADGQLAAAKATLYTVPADTKALVKFFRLYNTAAVTRTCNIYLKPGATSRQIVKMALQISDLDLKNTDVLENQLTGVDVAYFAELLAKVRADDPEKINSAYLIEIIDRMF